MFKAKLAEQAERCGDRRAVLREGGFRKHFFIFVLFFDVSLSRCFSELLHGSQLTFQRERGKSRERLLFFTLQKRATTRSEREANARDFEREKYASIRWWRFSLSRARAREKVRQTQKRARGISIFFFSLSLSLREKANI